MDLVELLAVLKDASPWVVLIGGTLIGLKMWFTHREASKKQSSESLLLKRIEELLTVQRGTDEMLATHVTTSESGMAHFGQVASRQTDLLSKIAQELVSLNASQAGRLISQENAKLLISYQWSWSCQETVRLLQNSIENNHFRGNEDLVSRRLLRAWRQVSKRACESVARLQGLEYPFRPLFERHILQAWSFCWEWAVPLYYREYQDKQAALDDLAERIKLLFEDIYASYCSLVEDIDQGTLYSQQEALELTSGEHILPEGEDIQQALASKMAQSLEAYEGGGESGGYDAAQVRTEVKRSFEESGSDVYTNGNAQDL